MTVISRRLFRVPVLAVLGAATVVTFFAGPAGSVPATKVTFTGSISCTLKGSLTATPPITLATTSHTLALKATLSGCSGSTSEGGVTISGGSLSAKSTVTASCTALSGGAPSGTITWKANLPGAAATKQSFSNSASSVSNGIITVKLPGSGGTATATGSFAGSTSTATAVIDQTESSLASQCVGSGVSKLTFTGKNGKSSITVG